MSEVVHVTHPRCVSHSTGRGCVGLTAARKRRLKMLIKMFFPVQGEQRQEVKASHTVEAWCVTYTGFTQNQDANSVALHNLCSRCQISIDVLKCTCTALIKSPSWTRTRLVPFLARRQHLLRDLKQVHGDGVWDPVSVYYAINVQHRRQDVNSRVYKSVSW